MKISNKIFVLACFFKCLLLSKYKSVAKIRNKKCNPVAKKHKKYLLIGKELHINIWNAYI